jgi:hypothetical protein
MIVERYTVQVKDGKWDEALELLKDGRKNIWPFFTCRIYSCNYGPFNTLVIDNEFKDMADLEKKWKKLSAKKKFSVFFDKWDKVTTEQGSHTLWTVE